MFKVLLVDDEVFVRKGLRKLIRWEELGFAVVGEAKNGGEALELIHKLEPDLVITDIMMPALDGLELIQRVKETDRIDPAFMIISGYNNFKYAQQAIRFGVHDYILKPVDVKEMTVTLQKLAVSIGKRRLSALAGENLAVGSVMEALVQGQLAEQDAEKYSKVLGLNGMSGFMYVLAELHTAPEAPLARLKGLQEAMSSYAGKSPIPLFEQLPGRFGMLLGVDMLKRRGGAWKALEEIQSEISWNMGVGVTIFAGDSTDRLKDIRQSYLAANEAYKHKFAESGSRVLLYSQVKDKPLNVFDSGRSVYDLLLVHMEENNKEACAHSVDSLFQMFRRSRYTPQAVLGSLSRFITEVMEVVEMMNGNTDRQQQVLKHLDERVCSAGFQQLKEYFTRSVTDAALYIAGLRKEQRNGEIEKIKKYIDCHYRDYINLKSIAARFYINPAYLGQLFRKTYGVYFNDYLLELRVEEAKKLLRQTDLRMYEISEKVGIRNANYFVSQFEKLEKLSPMEYRNKLIGKN